MIEVTLDDLMNLDLSVKYQDECRDLITDYLILQQAADKVFQFFKLKASSEDKTYYLTLLHTRSMEHFTSCIILISKGYVVDAYSLARSALENLLVMVNFEIDENYFNEWKTNDKKFRIRPNVLRGNIKKHSYFKKFHKYFENNYDKLCSVLHPSIDSVDLTLRTIIDNIEFDRERFRTHTITLAASFMAYLMILLSLLLNKYQDEDDQKNLHTISEYIRSIKKELWYKEVEQYEK